jgi:hypothetical protein
MNLECKECGSTDLVRHAEVWWDQSKLEWRPTLFLNDAVICNNCGHLHNRLSDCLVEGNDYPKDHLDRRELP